MTTIQALMLAFAILVGLRVGYEFGARRGPEDMGYIGCLDGHFTMKNFMIEGVKSEAFHIGVDPCGEHDDQGIIGMGERPEQKKP